MASPKREVAYIKGFNVRPSQISGFGIVTFEDGVNLLKPNQLQCEAYGYTYNHVTGTCSAFTFAQNLNSSLSNINNKIYGTGNSTQTGTNNTIILGSDNTVRGFSRNSIITGNKNEIANGVNNANVSGTLGEVTADNSTVLGGNANDDALGERQSIHLLYGIQTTDGVNTLSNLNNTTGSFFAIPDNSIVYFHADIVAVRVGGTAGGGVGDYASWVERGVMINESGVLSVKRERDTIKTNGTVTGWQPTTVVSGTDFAMRVRGATNMIIEWASDIKFTEIKTGVAL